MPKVFLNGHIDVPQERLAEVEAALPLHIELTRAEPGCLSFQVTDAFSLPKALPIRRVSRPTKPAPKPQPGLRQRRESQGTIRSALKTTDGNGAGAGNRGLGSVASISALKSL